MKIILTTLLFLASTNAFCSEVDSTGLEGDHLDLEAVLELFKNSESPEDFEKKLNTESSNVNNLDLNLDGEVDYIRVIDTGDSISHALTLQVPINADESQDVAIIELEETSEDIVEVQIVGDPELYGDDYILIPESAGKSPAIVNVIFWTPVRFMWSPRYKPWVSPWKYRVYPSWFRPWKRRPWRVYRGGIVVYRGSCRRVHRRSFFRAHTMHYHRVHSKTFVKTHKQQSNKTVSTSTNKSATKNSANTSKASQTKTSQSLNESKSNSSAPKKNVASEQNGGASDVKMQKQQKRASQKHSTKSSGATKSKSQSRKRPGGTKTKSSKRSGGGAAKRSGGRKRP
jgi:hypothetical protein